MLLNRLGGLNLPRKSVGRLTDRHDMTLDVYRGRKTTTQQQPEGEATNSIEDIFVLVRELNLKRKFQCCTLANSIRII